MAKRITFNKIVGIVAIISGAVTIFYAGKATNRQEAKGKDISQISISGNKNLIQEPKGGGSVAISGDHNQIVIPISMLRPDNGAVSDKENDSPDISLINFYKFQAIWNTNIGIYDGGNRNSYSALLDMEKSDNPIIKKLASDAIRTIKNAYDGSNIYVMRSSIERWNYICRWSVPPCANGFESPESYNVKNVFDHLSYKMWQEHARAISLLRNMDSPTNTNRDIVDKKDVCDKLIALMGDQESSLFVSKMALETYKVLIPDFLSSNVFDFTRAIEDWKQRRINFKDSLFKQTDSPAPQIY